MALTRDYQRIGTSTYTVTGNNELRLYAKYNSQSIANNTSNVTLQLRTIALNGSYYSDGNSSTLNCYGNRGTQYYDIGTVNTYSEKVIGTWTFDLSHNADGTLTGSYAVASANVYGSLNPSVGGWFDLPSIPRQASITEAKDFNDEENPTIKYSNPAGNNVTSLEACISLTGATDDISYRPVNKTGTSYTFELTEEERNILRNATPNSNTLNVNFYLKTILGGNTYFSIVSKKMTIVNANPIFSNFEFEDINPLTLALTGNNQYNINGYSNIQATISTTNKAVAKKGSSMSKYRFTCGTNTPKDITYSSSENVSETINGATSGIYNIYAIDSRKNTTLVTKIADRTIDYQPVYIDKQNTSISRDNNQVGDGAILTLNGTFWNNSFGQVTNNISVSYKFKKSDSSTWIDGTTTITPTITDEKFSFTGQIASDNSDTSWDLEANYDVKIIVEDELSSSTIDLILNSAIPTMSFDKEGVGILCAYDRNIGGALQVGGKNITDDIYSENEIKTNKIWIDKPIYRKVIHSGAISLSTTLTEFSTGITNADMILDINFMYKYSTSIWYKNWNLKEISYNINNNKVGVATTGSATFSDSYIIIEYTKTTNQATLNITTLQSSNFIEPITENLENKFIEKELNSNDENNIEIP